jgi:hypothetical protein
MTSEKSQSMECRLGIHQFFRTALKKWTMGSKGDGDYSEFNTLEKRLGLASMVGAIENQQLLTEGQFVNLMTFLSEATDDDILAIYEE